MDTIRQYFLEQIKTSSTWIGMTGLLLMMVGFQAWFLFALMIVVSDDAINRLIGYLVSNGGDAAEKAVKDIQGAE